jgi:hypothetical protein
VPRSIGEVGSNVTQARDLFLEHISHADLRRTRKPQARLSDLAHPSRFRGMRRRENQASNDRHCLHARIAGISGRSGPPTDQSRPSVLAQKPSRDTPVGCLQQESLGTPRDCSPRNTPAPELNRKLHRSTASYLHRHRVTLAMGGESRGRIGAYRTQLSVRRRRR